MSRIVLASGSPRRRELLEQMGLSFEVCPARGEEVITTDDPEEAVKALSAQKAREVAAGILSYNETHSDLTTPGDLMVIGADTVVACEGEILGKPSGEADARRMLSLLSGREHQVYTGVTVVLSDASGRCGEFTFCEETGVVMYPMTEEEISRYIATGEPMDKAGAYGIQGACAIHIRRIQGDYNNVVGLPIARLYQELRRIGADPFLWKN